MTCPLCHSSRPITATPRQVVEAVCAARNMDVAYVTSPRRSRRAVETRRIIARILRSQGLTLSAIGQYLGQRDHTTVSHLLREDARCLS